MKALIFNSGIGSRLGKLTASKPKSLVQLHSTKETILERQLRILHACGINHFVITTGPWQDKIEQAASLFESAGCHFTFVPNPAFHSTNYIFSMFLARDYLQDDIFVVLHGDLVFDASYLQKFISSEEDSIGSVNPALPLPKKDFKARMIADEIREVSVSIFDDDCVAFQPLYKLSQETMAIWLREVETFCKRGETNVYAEEAANKVFDQMHIKAFSYEGHCVEEIDTEEDLIRVSALIAEYE